MAPNTGRDARNPFRGGDKKCRTPLGDPRAINIRDGEAILQARDTRRASDQDRVRELALGRESREKSAEIPGAFG
jgi:hypothetical protein